MNESLALEPHPPLPKWYLPVMIFVALGAAYLSEIFTNANKERYFTPEGLPPFPPELLREIMWNNIYNHSICFGFLGAVLCGSLAMITAGLAGPSRAVVGFVLGSAAGLVGGALTGTAGYFITKTLQPMDIESILMAMVVFAPLWFVLGAITTIGSIWILGQQDWFGRALQMTLAATLAIVIIYPLVVTIAFPSDWPGRIIPEFARTRLTCFGLGSVGIALAMYLTLRGPKAARARASTEPEAT